MTNEEIRAAAKEEVVLRQSFMKVLFGKMNDRGVPEHLQQGLVDYLVSGLRPGDFLCAVLANDLQHSIRSRILRLDSVQPEEWTSNISMKDLHNLVLFLVWDVPADSWGSSERVRHWKGLNSQSTPQPPTTGGKGANHG